MKAEKLFNRIIALITLAVFSVPNSYAEPLPETRPIARNEAAIASLNIPDSLGDLGEIHFSRPEAPFVVILQDAHAVTDGQKSIQKLLAHLAAQYGFDLAAVEGAKGKLDASLIRSFPDDVLKRKVMDAYLNRSELTGAGLAAIMNDQGMDFYGIEDWPLYEQNYLGGLVNARFY